MITKQQTSGEYGISQELLIMSILNNYGVVSIPYGNSARYDCILDIDKTLYRIQIKSLNMIDDDTIVVPMSNSRMCSDGNVTKTYTEDEVDYIVICYNNQLYFFKPGMAKKTLTVRISKPLLANQHWIEEYHISKVLGIEILSWVSLKEKNRKEQKSKTNKYFCIECGKPVSNKNSRCSVCYKQFCTAKSSKPEREILKDKIKIMPFTQIGKEYGVTDNAVRKWCKSYNLPYRVKDIKEIIKKGEWENI